MAHDVLCTCDCVVYNCVGDLSYPGIIIAQLLEHLMPKEQRVAYSNPTQDSFFGCSWFVELCAFALHITSLIMYGNQEFVLPTISMLMVKILQLFTSHM